MAQDYYLCVRWNSDFDVDGEYNIFETLAEAEACWNSKTVNSSQNCACWAILESNNYVYTQNQANSVYWK